MLLSKMTYIAFKVHIYILSGTQTHDLGVASAILYFFDTAGFPSRKRPVMVKKLFI